MTARGRLTVAFALTAAGAAAAVSAVIYVFMRFVPSYAFGSVSTGSAVRMATLMPTPGPSILGEPGTGGTSGAGQYSFTSVGTITVSTAPEIFATLLWVCVIAVVVIAAIGFGIGRLMARRALRPLHHFNAAAAAAAAGGLSHRVALDGPRDEFTDLSDTFDDMLTRLDRTFQAQRRFTADASHELRTPLAAVKTMLDVARLEPHNDWAALIERLQITNQRSIDTVETLLDLADLGQGALDAAPVPLAAIVLDAMGFAAEEARAHEIVLHSIVVPVDVRGNSVLLRQLVTNLVQNAIRHNVAGGEISVTTLSSDGWGLLTVRNSGASIDPQSVEFFTRPFYRGTGRATNRRTPQSTGLGLSLVEAIATAHEGQLELVANPEGGLTVTVRLPLSGASR